MMNFIKAQFNASDNTVTAWTENNEIGFRAISEEDHDNYVTFENMVNFLEGAADLPEDFENYEDWAEYIFVSGEADDVLLDQSYCSAWGLICELAGIDENDYPYSDCFYIASRNRATA